MKPRDISEDTVIQVKLKHILWLIGIVGSLMCSGFGFMWSYTNNKFDTFIEKEYNPLKDHVNTTNVNVGIILDRTSGHNQTTPPSTPGEKSAPGQ